MLIYSKIIYNIFIGEAQKLYQTFYLDFGDFLKILK